MTSKPAPLVLPTRDAIRTMDPFIGLDLKNIHLVTTKRDAATAMNYLIQEKSLGFDTESKPTFQRGELSRGPHIIQFATLQRAYIFQTYQPIRHSAIAKILESKHIVKIGFGLNDDISRITAKLRIHSRSVIDVDNTFKRLGLKNSIGTKKAVALVFGKRLKKSHKITTSNWSNRRLSEKQLLYAANDAFAALTVFTALKKKGMVV
jgi:ribonuclease D